MQTVTCGGIPESGNIIKINITTFESLHEPTDTETVRSHISSTACILLFKKHLSDNE